jgi:hypothetical protein
VDPLAESRDIYITESAYAFWRVIMAKLPHAGLNEGF